jgi:predicted house-cleaning NTP pyrophosphatase (Maf/HAM1 superfamily)
MLILASRSPIRKALLDRAGIAVTAVGADVNEREIEAKALRENAGPARIAQLLAEAKAKAIDADAVIGADQVLELNGDILHKAGRSRRQPAAGSISSVARRIYFTPRIAIAKKGGIVWSSVDTCKAHHAGLRPPRARSLSCRRRRGRARIGRRLSLREDAAFGCSRRSKETIPLSWGYRCFR